MLTLSVFPGAKLNGFSSSKMLKSLKMTLRSLAYQTTQKATDALPHKTPSPEGKTPVTKKHRTH